MRQHWFGFGFLSCLVVAQMAAPLPPVQADAAGSRVEPAVPISAIPNPRRTNRTWVSDQANLLSSQTEAELNRLITQLEQRNGSEIAIVTVPNTAAANSPKAFATQLFNTWKIGKTGQNNGVLFLLSRSDRRVEIEIGTGLRTLLPDQQVRQILQQQVTPHLKQQRFDQGTLAATQALVSTLNASQSSGHGVAAAQPSNVQLIAAAINELAARPESEQLPIAALMGTGTGLLVVCGLWLCRFAHPKQCRSDRYQDSWSSSDSRTWSSDSSSSGSNGSDSSSDSSFGGGGSDGGGGGDSW